MVLGPLGGVVGGFAGALGTMAAGKHREYRAVRKLQQQGESTAPVEVPVPGRRRDLNNSTLSTLTTTRSSRRSTKSSLAPSTTEGTRKSTTGENEKTEVDVHEALSQEGSETSEPQ